MDYCRIIWFFLISSIILRNADSKHGKRNKRILWGQTADDNDRDGYEAFRYYVYLAQGDIVENPSWWRKHSHGLAPSTSELVCGGGLLTPLVVQTACHCLARYRRTNAGDNSTYAWPKNVWEERIYSFFGSNEVSKMTAMAAPKRYIVYEQCRKFKFGFSFSLLDFGLIINSSPVHWLAPEAPLSYAPSYKAKDISEFYYDALRKEYMCLHIGHGYWDLVYDDSTYNFKIQTEASEVQRWGSRTVMSYEDCMSATYTPSDRSRRGPFFNYTAETTWVCFKVFKETSKYDYNYAEGDSGGPVSCNGVHFAVVTMSESIESENVISYASPIIYTLFENAADNRKIFVDYVTRYFIHPDVPGMTDIPLPQPVYPDHIPTPPPHLRLSLGTIHHHVSILPPLIFFVYYVLS